MTRLHRVLGVLATAAVVAALVPSPASALTPVVVKPAALPRGDDVRIPHLEGTTVVDGSLRIPVGGKVVRFLGRTGAAYVVGTASERGGHGRIWRVEADGSRSLLAKSSAYGTVLAEDGSRVVGYRVPGNGTTTVVTAWSTTDGTQLAQRTFQGFDTVLDASADQVLIGNDSTTLLWTTSSDHVATLAHQAGYAGDLAHGLMATFTRDPFRGGCSLVSEIASGKPIWRSCTERVDAFSTDGSHLATVSLLSDGIGPTVVTTRKVTGKAVGRYVIKKGWFGELTFESPKTLLLEANALPQGATVRCTGATCERASDLTKTPTPRQEEGEKS